MTIEEKLKVSEAEWKAVHARLVLVRKDLRKKWLRVRNLRNSISHRRKMEIRKQPYMILRRAAYYLLESARQQKKRKYEYAWEDQSVHYRLQARLILLRKAKLLKVDRAETNV